MTQQTPDWPRPNPPAARAAPCPRRLRGYLGGRLVLDTEGARYVWGDLPYPSYAVPTRDVRTGPGADRVPWAAVPGHDGFVGVAFSALDAWFEEDEQVFVHPRDPYSRLDCLRTSRHLTVSVGGVLLAESRSYVTLYETGLPPRRYLPRTDVRLDLLTPSPTVTSCPYKGTTGGYWSVQVDGRQRDIAWSYTFTTREVQPVAGLVAFFDERVDVVLDGRPLPRPVTPFG